MNLEKLQELHAEVWKWRARMESTFPTPPRQDALWFSQTELAECLNVLLNAKGIYKRNHSRDKDLYLELAQCAMMLFTALGPDAKLRWASEVEPTVEHINFEIANAVLLVATETNKTLQTAMVDGMIAGALWAIARYPGMDLERQLALALGELEAKWGPKEQVSINEVYDEHRVA